jgi:predicted SAM-dependent methyltransferase
VLKTLLKHVARAAPAAGERRLHIGGLVRAEGWEVLNIAPGPAVDHVGDAVDLGRFPDGVFGAVYGSHVLEHLDFKGQLQSALREWFRVLRPGGCLYVAVPDFAVIAQLFLAGTLSLNDRFRLVMIAFGGHNDAHDYHQVAFDFEILGHFLREAGFADVERVAQFGIFDDTSRMVFAGAPISLNVVARKPGG